MNRDLRKAEDLTGKTFGLLTVMYRCDYSMCGAIWHCQCACGNEADVRATQLRTGSKKAAAA